APDGLDVDLLQRRRADAHAVDLPAVTDELLHELRDVVAAGVAVYLGPSIRVDLDAARARELRGRSRSDDLAREQDHDAVADELDLAQQMRVQQHGDAAASKLLEQRADRPPADGI